MQNLPRFMYVISISCWALLLLFSSVASAQDADVSGRWHLSASGVAQGCTAHTPNNYACGPFNMGDSQICVNQTGTQLTSNGNDVNKNPYILEGNVNNNSVNFTITGTGITPGVGPATTTYTGTVDGNIISGNLSGQASWSYQDDNGNIITETATWTGTFTVKKKFIIETILDKNYWCPPLWPFSPQGNVDGQGLDDWFYRRITDGVTNIELWGINKSFIAGYFALMVNGSNLIGACVYDWGMNLGYVYRNACTNNITHVIWESHDAYDKNVGNAIWAHTQPWIAVAGKDYLRFKYDVATNKLTVTHFSENGAILTSYTHSMPAVPSNSFTIDGVVLPELDSSNMTAIPAIEFAVDPLILVLTDSRLWFQVYLKFRLGNGLADVKPGTIRLNGVLAPGPGTTLVDRDQDGELELLLNFDLVQVKNLLGLVPGNQTITITGELLDGTSFRDQRTILVRKSAALPDLNLLLLE